MWVAYRFSRWANNTTQYASVSNPSGDSDKASRFRVKCSLVKPNMSINAVPGNGYLIVPMMECVSTFICTTESSNSFTAMAYHMQHSQWRDIALIEDECANMNDSHRIHIPRLCSLYDFDACHLLNLYEGGCTSIHLLHDLLYQQKCIRMYTVHSTWFHAHAREPHMRSILE